MSTMHKRNQWNAICDRCGFQFKSSELIEEWQGLRVCKKDYEPRHPQDFIRVRVERQAIPWSRPENLEGLGSLCTPQGSSAIPNFSIPNCMIPSTTLASCTTQGSSAIPNLSIPNCMVPAQLL